MSENTNNDEASPALVAKRMADAVQYLSDVALGAGLESISADLLSIRGKLAERASSGGQDRNQKSGPLEPKVGRHGR